MGVSRWRCAHIFRVKDDGTYLAVDRIDKTSGSALSCRVPRQILPSRDAVTDLESLDCSVPTQLCLGKNRVECRPCRGGVSTELNTHCYSFLG